MLKKTLIKGIAALSLSTVAATAIANERIISAGSAVTELILALEQQNQLVAVDVTSELPQNLTLPKIGYHRNLSSEGLMALNPTRLIGSDEMGPETSLSQLKTAGVEVNIVNTLPTPEGLLERIDEIAALTDSQKNAEVLKAEVNQQISSLEKNKAKTKEAPKVLFLLIHEGRPANVAGANTTPNAIIELAGGINPAASKLDSYKPLSTEAMLEMQPDVILVSGRSYEKMGGADAILAKMPLLAATPAGQSKNIITVDGHALVGGLGLKSLSEAERLSLLLTTME
ncbi:hemin ABC transporter substrate-binding protein [Vibrio sp. Isolate25]|uniref:heme/hemin ABC transporter substrate-binding protein n=1 Tax=Vibrio TaxID=662 RepID=UPI001EFE2E90|nr:MULTISPECIES: hemin ABC transporter substrate-binding protein [Vibrio]MCG9595965.1 hemin ABC transporter substrate-binding protein [Vibrio sp. Isolate25]USD35136.1 hemin ABC transporter substrate-binding protein [Vibrio sp. SCSIO 43186]USD48201.1 hemin ABC transporter substrate-binding protein [Vibrio sp. SCSIO 43145]USD72261.1 hemin ABC transporter substrate-binding protein [Vibrio sp. SCSIO 43139]USD97936.1 hemin ABC transporter substrate-binding protein [Vibrio coralliilyticus]